MRAGQIAGALYSLIDSEWGNGDGKDDEPTPYRLSDAPSEREQDESSFLFAFPGREDSEFEVIVRRRNAN